MDWLVGVCMLIRKRLRLRDKMRKLYVINFNYDGDDYDWFWAENEKDAVNEMIEAWDYDKEAIAYFKKEVEIIDIYEVPIPEDVKRAIINESIKEDYILEKTTGEDRPTIDDGGGVTYE